VKRMTLTNLFTAKNSLNIYKLIKNVPNIVHHAFAIYGLTRTASEPVQRKATNPVDQYQCVVVVVYIVIYYSILYDKYIFHSYFSLCTP
jgi:hypothetical protein